MVFINPCESNARPLWDSKRHCPQRSRMVGSLLYRSHHSLRNSLCTSSGLNARTFHFATGGAIGSPVYTATMSLFLESTRELCHLMTRQPQNEACPLIGSVPYEFALRIHGVQIRQRDKKGQVCQRAKAVGPVRVTGYGDVNMNSQVTGLQ